MCAVKLIALGAVVASATAASVLQDADAPLQSPQLKATFVGDNASGFLMESIIPSDLALHPHEGRASAAVKGMGAASAAAPTEGLKQETAAAGAIDASSIFYTLRDALLEGVCFFFSLASVRLLSSHWIKKGSMKLRCSTGKACPVDHQQAVVAGSIAAAGATKQPLAVIKAWHCQKAHGPVPVESLRVVAWALAEANPECLVKELTSHVKQHAAVLARPGVVHRLLDSVSQVGRPDLVEALAAGVQEQLKLPVDIRMQEILLEAFASAGDARRVDELLKIKPEGEFTAHGYALVIKGFLRSAKAATAMRYMLEMQKAGHEVPQRAVVELYKTAISQGSAADVLSSMIRASVPLPTDCVAPLLVDCAQREDFDTALQVEQLTRAQRLPLTHASFEALLKLHAKAKDAYGVKLMEEMQQAGFSASEGLCGCILAKCAESQNLQLTEHVATYLRSRSAMTLSTYKTLMKVYACSGLYDKACDLYPEVLAAGIKPDAVMYGCLVKFAVKCGRPALSQELFEKAGGGYVQNYMWLIRSAGREGNVKRALELLHQLEADQPEGLDIMVYNCALDACVMNGEMERAQALLKETQKSFSLNLVTYNTLMKGHSIRGDVPQAWRVFQQMEHAGITPDTASFNSLISTAVTAGNMSQVWAVLAEMDRRSVRVDQYTLSTIMKACRMSTNPRDVDRGFAVLDRAGVNICKDEVLLNTVLDTCIHRRQKGRLAKAIETYLETTGMTPSVRTYGLLIKGCSILKMLARCWDLWQEMVQQRRLTPNNITFSCMLDALIEAHQIEGALALFREWKARMAYNTVVYSTLIKGFANTGDADRAMALFTEMKADGVQMNIVAYTALIDSQARNGNAELAKALLQRMEGDGCQPNVITFSALIKGYCINGDIDEALRVFQQMLDRGLAADTVIFNTLLDGCVKHSCFELADRLLQDMDKSSMEPSNFTISIVVKMWGKRRNLDKAFATVRSSLKEPNKLYLDAMVGACLVNACLYNHSLDRAVEAFEEIKSWGRSDCPNVNTYGSLICALARQGQCQQAVALVDEVTSSTTRGTQGPLEGEPLRLLFKAIHAHGHARELGRPLLERLRARGVQVEPKLPSGF